MGKREKLQEVMKGNKNARQYTEKQITGIANELMDWADKESTVTITSFCVQPKYRKPQEWIYHLARHNPEIKEALKYIRTRIAERFHINTLNGTYNVKWSHRVIGYYDKALDEWDDFKKAKQQSQAIEMDRQKNYQVEDFTKAKLDEPYNKIYEDNVNKARSGE